MMHAVGAHSLAPIAASKLKSFRLHLLRFSQALSTCQHEMVAPLQDFGALPRTPDRRVVVTGLGIVSPLGNGVQATWSRLVRGDCAVRQLQPDDLLLSTTVHTGGLAAARELASSVVDQLSSRVAAVVPRGTEEGTFDQQRWAPAGGRVSLFVGFALAAAEEALRDAKWQPATVTEREATGVSIGAGMGSLAEISDAGILMAQQKLRKLSPYFIPKVLVNMPAGLVSIQHKLEGPCHAGATACSSGAHAIADAWRLIRGGDADVMLAGASDACIDAVSIMGFARLRALATKFNEMPQAASRPFDEARDGFVIGEGAAVMVLEELEHARQRGARIYAELRGAASTADGHHVTLPPEDGRGAARAMRRALQVAGLRPEEVGYINAHATSTPNGDVAEWKAIEAVFGDRAIAGDLPVSSTKGAFGHLLGAAGALEAAVVVKALETGVLPPTLNLHAPDKSIPTSVNLIPCTAQSKPDTKVVLTNSFGFGGTNACLVFSAPPPLPGV
eukprot:jgi/Mesvir1/23568/Mv18264-RA.2